MGSALLLAGCGQKSSQSGASGGKSDGGGSTLTAPVDYLNSAAKAEKSAVKTVDTTALTQAIQLFYADKGRYPKDLNELVTEKFMPRLPEAPYGMKIEYNATDGTVKVVKK